MRVDGRATLGKMFRKSVSVALRFELRNKPYQADDQVKGQGNDLRQKTQKVQRFLTRLGKRTKELERQKGHCGGSVGERTKAVEVKVKQNILSLSE